MIGKTAKSVNGQEVEELLARLPAAERAKWQALIDDPQTRDFPIDRLRAAVG